jgi:Tfp pilus assembly protein PilO
VTNADLETLLRTLRPEVASGACLACLALTLLAGHLYLIRPAQAKLEELDASGPQATIESVTSELNEGNLELAALEERLVGLRDQLYGGPSSLPPEKIESYIIERLDGLSGRYAIELVSVKPGDAKQVLMFDEIVYEVEVKGEYRSLVAWLRELERELRPMVVNEFNLKPELEGRRVGMRLRLASYRPRGGTA